MRLAGYQLNLDALLARIIFRWRWQATLGSAAVLALVGIGIGLVPPFWRGTAMLSIDAPAAAVVTVDGTPWRHQLYAGDHRVVAALPDGRTSWADVSLAAGQALTLTLPAGLPAPRVRALPPPAPGFTPQAIWWADGAWRVRSEPLPIPTRESETQRIDPTPTVEAGQTVAIRMQGTERLSTLDAYAGLADQVHVNDRLIEAVFLPDQRGDAIGVVAVRGWGAEEVQIPLSAPLALLRFAPTGTSLLIVERVPGSGEQVSLVWQDAERASLVAVPGHITRVSWREDGSAAVLYSRQGDRLTLTLLRLASSVAASVIADVPADQYVGDLVPLTWDAASLLWVAPDQHTTPTLWRSPLATLIPERIGPLDARALDWTPDGVLRVAVVQQGAVVLGRYQDGRVIGQATVPDVEATSDLAGMWQGDQLLLQGGGKVWLLDVPPDDDEGSGR
jgi:hypothetical protein